MFVCSKAYENLIWVRIPKFYVRESVNNFLDNRQINDCFYKFDDDDTLLLKCWRNNKLVDVEITVKNGHRRKKYMFESISI
jgi:hypothetical protein